MGYIVDLGKFYCKNDVRFLNQSDLIGCELHFKLPLYTVTEKNIQTSYHLVE